MNKMEFGRKMQARTKAFAIQLIKLYGRLPKSDEARVVGRQMLRSGTSVAANYRAVCRAKSEADFIHKLGTAVEEADETLFWLEILEESELYPAEKLLILKQEADELLRILSTSLATAKHNSQI